MVAMTSPRLYRICILLAITNLTSERLLASIRPSFMLDDSAWRATTIVAVHTTKQAGLFDVDESWKGNLRPHELVFVPELRPENDAVPISAYPKTTPPFANVTKPSTQIPRPVPGSLMILFLRRGLPATESNPQSGWHAGGRYDVFKTSVLWIEGGRVYGFQQLWNPGPSILTILRLSEPRVRGRIAEIINIQRELDDALMIEDGSARVIRLKPYVHSDAIPARQLALSELGKCGPSAISTIRAMLDDAAFGDEAPDIVKTYVAAGGELVGDDLNARLRAQLKFWRATGPSLAVGWWNEIPTSEPLRNRYSLTIELVLALERIRYADALSTARELRDFWRSLPQLNDPRGLKQLSEECDRLIQHLTSN